MIALTNAVLASQAALYGPPAGDRIAELIDAADALTAALQFLRTHPAEGAERPSQHSFAGASRAGRPNAQ